MTQRQSLASQEHRFRTKQHPPDKIIARFRKSNSHCLFLPSSYHSGKMFVKKVGGIRFYVRNICCCLVRLLN